MLRDLFGFDYLWEVYTPEHSYPFFPSCSATASRDREPRYDRKARSLHINGIWFEDVFGPMEEPYFIPALTKALRAYRCGHDHVAANTPWA